MYQKDNLSSLVSRLYLTPGSPCLPRALEPASQPIRLTQCFPQSPQYQIGIYKRITSCESTGHAYQGDSAVPVSWRQSDHRPAEETSFQGDSFPYKRGHLLRSDLPKGQLAPADSPLVNEAIARSWTSGPWDLSPPSNAFFRTRRATGKRLHMVVTGAVTGTDVFTTCGQTHHILDSSLGIGPPCGERRLTACDGHPRALYMKRASGPWTRPVKSKVPPMPSALAPVYPLARPPTLWMWCRRLNGYLSRLQSPLHPRPAEYGEVPSRDELPFAYPSPTPVLTMRAGGAGARRAIRGKTLNKGHRLLQYMWWISPRWLVWSSPSSFPHLQATYLGT